MSIKTELWDRLGKTDPSQTKQFQRSGGFRGTAVKPIWSFRRMTEEFGPCGVGWGVGEPKFEMVHATEGEVLVYCTASVWHGSKENIVYGVGGDKAVGKNRNGLMPDDEAFKKAFTDAVTNALKLIGVAADVHMGLFDDHKYVSELKAEFSEEKRQNPHVTRPTDVFDPDAMSDHDNIPRPETTQKLRVVDQKPLFAQLQKEIHAIGSTSELAKWAADNANRTGGLKDDWYMMLRGVYAQHRDELRKQEQGDDARMAG